jgi:3-oxoacyl-[acyl-carrier protein] reductase
MRTILIIGGSKGIGKAVIKELIDTNKVINFSRTTPAFSHPNLQHYTIDVLKDSLPELEAIDGIVYCPGSINLKPISRLTEQDFKSDFDINVLGAVRVIQKYLKILKAGKYPSIIMFSTVAVKLGMPFHASTAVSKAAIEGLVKTLGAEFAPLIRVNAIAPTITETGLADKILRNDMIKEKMKERHPLKTYLQPKDVAEMVHFLISEKSKTISGQVIKLDCGIVSFKI